MRAAVRSAFLAFTAPLEGRVRHLHLDVQGLVTTGVGHLVDTVAEAQRLPWQVGDGGPAATPEQIAAEWATVKSRQDLRNTPAERAFGPITTLRLSDAAIDELVLAKLDANEARLRRTPEFASFDEWPADAQLGLLSMAWAMGPAFTDDHRWPSFRGAVALHDWAAAGEHSRMNAADNPGLAARNTANHTLFSNAARVVAGGLDRDVLLGGAAEPVATGRVIFTSGSTCVPYDVATDRAHGAIALGDHWKNAGAAGFDTGVRAVVAIGAARYAFRGTQHVRVRDHLVDDGYPLGTAQCWPGFADTGFDTGVEAAVDLGHGKLCFFKGGRYLRYDVAANAVDPGYPRPVVGNWPGVVEAGFDTVDAILGLGNGKLYFFRGEAYARFDVAADRVDDGYPRAIAGHWPGLAEAGIAGPVDAAWLE